MGFFADLVYAGGAWGAQSRSEPFIALQIEDSDIAVIDYAPVPQGAAGRCYLGYEPRHYYEDPSASQPVDTAAEARGLAEWARVATGANVKAKAIQKMLASPKGKDPKNDFVEDTVARLLPALGLPLPPDLSAE